MSIYTHVQIHIQRTTTVSSYEKSNPTHSHRLLCERIGKTDNQPPLTTSGNAEPTGPLFCPDRVRLTRTNRWHPGAAQRIRRHSVCHALTCSCYHYQTLVRSCIYIRYQAIYLCTRLVGYSYALDDNMLIYSPEHLHTFTLVRSHTWLDQHLDSDLHTGV